LFLRPLRLKPHNASRPVPKLHGRFGGQFTSALSCFCFVAIHFGGIKNGAFATESERDEVRHGSIVAYRKQAIRVAGRRSRD
jgi:hypothetical protein